MSDDSDLLDHARRYFRQAAQSTDARKMKLLGELAFDYLRLAREDALLAERPGETKRRE